MSNKLELDVSTHEEIKALCAKGDRLAEAKSYEAAIAEYNKDIWHLGE